MNRRKLLWLLFVLSLVIAGCASAAPTTAPTIAPTVAPTIAPTIAPTTAATGLVVNVAESDLGPILVDGEGMTLYGFVPDEETGEPTCYDQCAATWPPVLADDGFTVAGGVSQDLFTTSERTDGGTQLKAGGHPLYHFANDAAPGDTNGQGLNDVWYVVGADGQLIGTSAGPSPSEAAGGDPVVTLATTDLGEILVDAEGNTLYALLPDGETGEPTCYDQCAENWPALLVEGEFAVGEGLSADAFSTAERTDGGTQLVIGDYPLYRFAHDPAPGATDGQGVSDVWYVVDADGQPIQ